MQRLGSLLLAVTLLAVVNTCANAKMASGVSSNIALRKKGMKYTKDVISIDENNNDYNNDQMTSTSTTSILAAASTAAPFLSPKLAQTLAMAGLFTLWYGFNAGYNVFNAFMKKDLQYPWASASMQLAVGLLYAFPLWFLGLRQLPTLTFEDIKLLLPIAMLNAGGHACAVVAMFEKGGGSFTHVVKAAEPVVSVFLNLLVNGVVPKPLTAISLLPITYGVAYASTLGNLNFKSMSNELTTKAAKMAMCSNFAFAMRSILRKNLPSNFKSRTKLDPANEHAVTTFISLLLTFPFALFFEGLPAITSAIRDIKDQQAFAINTFVCGMSFYLYNEMQNKVLGSLGAVPTAVGNTLKRVVIFVALYFFTQGETFPMPKIIGCAIAIAGCLSFAIADSKKI